MSLIITLSGMSTSGKSTLAAALTQRADCFEEVVSFTTRPKRLGEIDGVHYHFVEEAVFVDHINKGQMLEHVFSHGHYYGVPFSEVNRIRMQGKSPISVMEPIGVGSVNRFACQHRYPMISVFIAESMDKIMQRFTQRIHDQLLAGKAVDYDAEAKRLHTILTQERHWEGMWDWSVRLSGLSDPAVFDRQVDRFTQWHRVSERFMPEEKSLGRLTPASVPNYQVLAEPVRTCIEQHLEPKILLESALEKISPPLRQHSMSTGPEP